jgi:WD40 repeat protein
MAELSQTVSARALSSGRRLEGRLAELWQQGQRPDVQQFLAAAGPLSATHLAAVLAVDQREHWQRGERVRAEAYLGKYAALRQDRERALELVYGEFLLREERGEAPTLEEYVRRFPQYAARLQEQIELHRAAAQAASQPEGPVAGFRRSGESDRRTGAGSTPVGRAAYDFLAPPRAPGELGRLGRYRVLGLLGAGGMGMVFRAEDTLLRRSVALKVLLPALAADIACRQRFLREARAVAALDHPHIIAIHDLGEERGLPFLAMPLLLGESLAERLRRQPPLPLAEAVRVGREIAEGLAAAHGRGLIHRDIKPANVWLEGSQGWVKILDFGLARTTDDAAQPTGLTQTGDLLGTPAYLAPEQAGGERLDHRCDLFSLGCVLYRACTGELPFKGSNAFGMVAAVLTQVPRRPEELNPQIPPVLSELVLRLLAKERERRPGSAAEVAEALAGVERELPQTLGSSPPPAKEEFRGAGPVPPFVPSRRPSRPWLGVVLAAGGMLLLLGLGVFPLLVQEDPDWAGDGKDFSADQQTKARTPSQPSKDQAPKNKPSEKPFEELHRLLGHTHYAWGVAYSPDGKRLGSASFDKSVKVWDVATRQDLLTLWGHTSAVYCVVFNPCGGTLASASNDRTIKVWDVTTGQMLKTLRGHARGVHFLAYSRDGKRLASTSADHTVKVWDVATGQELLTLRGHTGPIWGVAYSPDGKRLASASTDHTVKVWDAATGTELHTLKGHTDRAYGVAFSPDSRRLVSTSLDQTVRVWNVRSGRLLLTLEGRQGAVRCVAYSPDGKWLATGGDMNVKVWDAGRGEELFTLEGHATAITALAFSPDGKRLVTASPDRTVRIWGQPGS